MAEATEAVAGLVEEVRRHARVLEEEIAEACDRFQRTTALAVTEVRLQRVEMIGRSAGRPQVHVEVELR